VGNAKFKSWNGIVQILESIRVHLQLKITGFGARYFFVFTGFVLFGNSSLQSGHFVPSHPRAVQCSRP